MDHQNDSDYHRARAEVSRRLAAQASMPAVAAIHREFARRYDALAEPVRPAARLPG